MSGPMSPFGYPPAGPPDEDFVANAGAPLQPGVAVAPFEAVEAGLRTVFDPEIPVNIYDLGLIYDCDLAADGSVKINMSLTAPGCPVAGTLPGEVARAVAEVEGIGEVEVKLVWEPAWSPERMTEDARLALGMI